ncbi:MAG: histidine phosphatase family protein [Polyangiaceae bacterium]
MPPPPAKLELVLVRHGESVGNREGRMQGHRDYPLSPRGREQARELAAFFRQRGVSFSSAYTSPLSRAKETAQILCANLELPPAVEDADLKEITAGCLEGLDHSQIVERHPTFMQRGLEGLGDFSEFGGESYDDMQARVERLCAGLYARHDGQGERLLLVSHGGLLFQLAKHLISVPVPRVSILRYGNCTASLIRMRERRGTWLGELVWHVPLELYGTDPHRDVGALFR